MSPRKAKSTRRPKGSGTFWRDRSGRWLGRTTYKGQRIDVADPDRAGAENKLAARKREIDKQIDRDGARLTLADFLAWWLETVMTDQIDPSTWHNYRQRIEIYILPNSIAQKRLVDILPRDIRAWLNGLRTNYAHSSVKQARALLERALDVAVAEHYIEANPAAAVRPPRPPRVKVADDDDDNADPEVGTALAAEQVDAFLVAARARPLVQVRGHGSPQPVSRWTDFSLLYTLGFRLGARKGELLGMRVEDIDFDAKTWTVTGQVQTVAGKTFRKSWTKTDAGRRTLPLSDDLIALIREHLVKTGRRSGLLFVTESGKPIIPRNLVRHFKEIVRRAGLPMHVRFHDLRHTAISAMKRAGVSAQARARLAGHKHIDVTENVYTHADEQELRAAIERVALGG